MSRNRKRKCPYQQQRVSVEKNLHHIRPTSRCPELRWEKDNQVLIAVSEHTRYHAMFTNRLPEEVLDYIVYYFWGGRLDIVFNWLETKRIKTKGKQPYYEDDPLGKESYNEDS